MLITLLNGGSQPKTFFIALWQHSFLHVNTTKNIYRKSVNAGHCHGLNVAVQRGVSEELHFGQQEKFAMSGKVLFLNGRRI